MRKKPDHDWIAFRKSEPRGTPGCEACAVKAPTWYLARQRAAVAMREDPDNLTVTPA